MKPSQEPPKRRGVAGFFVRGVVTLLPAILTMVVFGLLFQMVNRYVTGPINSVIYWSLEGNTLGWRGLDRLGIDPLAKEYLEPSLLPLDLQTTATTSPRGYNDPRFLEALSLYRHEHLGFFRDLEDLAINPNRLRNDIRGQVHPLIGVVVSLLLVLWLGWLVGGFIGRRFVLHLDRTMRMIPLVKSIYPYSKQLVDFFFEKKKLEFDTVVSIPFPGSDSWAIAFMTSGSMRTVDRATGLELVTVFLPTSPMPMTGYTLFVDVRKVIPLPVSVDEAIRTVMTGGVLIPERERVERGIADVIAAEGVATKTTADEDGDERKERA